MYENREKRGFVIFIDIIESMFNIGITIFNNLSEKLVFNIRNISNAFSKKIQYEKMILSLLNYQKIILERRTVNTIT